ncbi:metallophosphoesterase family protein [Mucilaginibacter ginsenosidivorans]|uniref:Metallophosphoesterase n=1 Tax=Mucilaginibacter ginsenosidivorans TaxID=398053 RepID=A0A5B8US26_9SPHI|nr:metallophosphoesterase [Mucilaginibacter ginsenosidivorans]QEC61759.1 metallophosphoesterase [Mucilaginibacter ginsenosidivorans]
MNAKKTKTRAGANQPPRFGETQVTPDPTKFRLKHLSDQEAYNLVQKKLLQPIPKPKNPDNLVLKLETVLGRSEGNKIIKDIQKEGKIVFHMVGDTGPTGGPKNIDKVTDKLQNDFLGEPDGEAPRFLFHLGDIVYSFGEGKYYYDQFYEPFRNYQAPILAIPGNHDGLVYETDPTPTLDAFLRNFVTEKPVTSTDAGGLSRTTMIQPAVYFAFDAPFVTIIGLYSNVLEDPGVISSEGHADSPVSDEQLAFLTSQLKRVKNSGNAVIVAVHHPPFAWGGDHGGSPKMLKEIDDACKEADFWPHAVISGHAHNQQRFTRTVGDFDIPYIIIGNSGHNCLSLKSTKTTALRAPINLTKDLIFESYDDKNYGYLRLVCDSKQLRIEYHDDDPDQKSYSDAVTVDLKTHTMISN